MVIFAFADAAVDDGAGLDGALVVADHHPPARCAWPASMRTIRQARPRRV